MQFLFDIFPVILFFIAFEYAGRQPEQAAAWVGRILGETPADQAPILIATMVVILATFFQIAWVWFKHGKVGKMLWFSLTLVTILGGMTLIFHDPTFIKWKPTVLYWGMASGMLVATFFKKNAIRAVMQEQVKLPEALWYRLNLAWIIFLAAMGVLNLYVAFNYSIGAWVRFKMFGTFGLMLLFIVAQGVYLQRYIEDEKPSQ